MNDIPANLIYSPYELEKWLADTSVPLSDDEIKVMSTYFDSENFKFPNNSLFDMINSSTPNNKQQIERLIK